MAKNSDKRRVLNRRKQELDHAITHGFEAAVIARRADRLRAAAMAVIKKCRYSFAHVGGAPGNQKWIEMTEGWERLTTDEIIEITRKWQATPSLGDVELSDQAG